MTQTLLSLADIGPADGAQILRHLNGATDARALAETIGFSEGLDIGTRIAAELVAARPYLTLAEVNAVSGITPVRFSELAVALSGARPPLAQDRLDFLPAPSPLWLGQTVNVTARLTDMNGVGIVGRSVTCLTSAGHLSARAGLENQTGSAIRIAPEPGGLVRFSYGLGVHDTLGASSRAALAAEIASFARNASTPVDAQKTMAALASRYRGQGSGALQAAIDALFDRYAPAPYAPMAPWPLQPVTILALTHDEKGRVLQIAALTLEFRNWLGAFYEALKGQINADTSLLDALANLKDEAEAGRDLSRKLIQATEGFATLERGQIGRTLRDSASGPMLNAFLETTASALEGDAIVNTVRSAGASEAAIAAGGLSVFSAVRSVQEVEDVIKPRTDIGGLTLKDLAPLDDRLLVLEDSSVTQTDLQQFGRSLSSDIDARFSQIKETIVTKDALDALRTDLIRDVSRQLDARISTVDARLDDLVTRNELDEIRADFARDVDTRLARVEVDPDRIDKLDSRLEQLESSFVKRGDLDDLAASLTRDFDAKLGEMGDRQPTDPRLDTLRADMDARFAGIEENVARQMRTKANARSLTTLQNKLDELQVSQTKTSANLDDLKLSIGRNNDPVRGRDR